MTTMTKEYILKQLLDPKFRRFERNGVVICDSNECSEFAYELYVNGIRFAGSQEPDSLVERFLRIAI